MIKYILMSIAPILPEGEVLASMAITKPKTPAVVLMAILSM
jgi:hypothetical protein